MADDKTAWAVKDIVEAHGFSINYVTASNSSPEMAARAIMSVATLQRIYRYGGAEALEFVLSVIKDLWPGDPNRIKEVVLGGLYSFWIRMKGEVDVERLVDRLSGTLPAKLMYSAQLGSGDRTTVMADLIEKFYRKTKKTAK